MKAGLAFAQRRPGAFCDQPGHQRIEAAEFRKPFGQRRIGVQRAFMP